MQASSREAIGYISEMDVDATITHWFLDAAC